MSREQKVLELYNFDNIDQAGEFTIPINQTMKLIITLTKNNIRDQEDFSDAVVTSRGIKQPQQYSFMNEEVVELADHMARADEDMPHFFQVKHKTANTRREFLQRALKLVQDDCVQQAQAARMEATLAVILREATLVITDEDGKELQRIERGLFSTRVTPHGGRVTMLHPKVWEALKEEAGTEENIISSDYFDNSAINRQRRADGLPDLPSKYPGLPAEQMIAYINAMRENFVLFSNAMATMWQNYISQIVEVAFALSGEEDPVDPDGFQPESVDTSLAE